MKNSAPISSDVWEEKRALIAALYKDEEWPLKQVIKKIRSESFNPSETQLRSRLKKWRVTKPSRQTRKKSEEARSDTGEVDHDRGCFNDSPRVRTHAQPAPAKELSANKREWYKTMRTYEPRGVRTITPGGQGILTVWGPASSHSSPLGSPDRCRVSSHASLSVSTSNSYDPSQPSPLVDGALLNPNSSMTPTFSHLSYPLDSDSCIQTPASTTTPAPPVHWPIPQYYSIPFETSRESVMPLYTTAPLTPPIDHSVNTTPLQTSQQMAGFHDGLDRLRNQLSPYELDSTQEVRQPSKPLRTKIMLPSKIATSQYPATASTPTSPFYPGQYLSMCLPNYGYSDPEDSLVPRSTVGF